MTLSAVYAPTLDLRQVVLADEVAHVAITVREQRGSDAPLTAAGPQDHVILQPDS